MVYPSAFKEVPISVCIDDVCLPNAQGRVCLILTGGGFVWDHVYSIKSHHNEPQCHTTIWSTSKSAKTGSNPYLGTPSRRTIDLMLKFSRQQCSTTKPIARSGRKPATLCKTRTISRTNNPRNVL
jgi:hypothetical protein